MANLRKNGIADIHIVKYALNTPEDFNYAECLKFLTRNDQECLFAVEDQVIFTSLKADGHIVPFSIEFSNDELKVDLPRQAQDKHANDIIAYVSDWFDLNRNLEAFYHLLETDSSLRILLRLKGLRMIGIPDLFEALCWSIIGQQINLNFAYRLKRRLVQHYGMELVFKEKRFYRFPSPERLITVDEGFQKANQFSRSKVKYLKNIAEAFLSKKISKEKLLKQETFEEKQFLLTSVKGIGEWSANYALMKCLHEPNAIPYGDTGLTQALFNLGLISDRKNRSQVEEFFRKVAGWESYTTFYLWHSLIP